MRILLLGLHRFTQPFGLCRYTANLFQSLKQIEDCQTILVLGTWQKDYYKRSLKLNVEDRDILCVDLARPSLSRYRWYLLAVPTLARQYNADIVHAAFPMPFVKRWISCPIVTTMHDLYAYDAPKSIGYPNVWLNKLVLQQSIRSSDSIIAISQFAKDSLRKWFPDLEARMPLPVIYQDFKPKASTERLSEAVSNASDPRFFLCVAQHRKNKNLDLVIEGYLQALRRGIVEKTTQLVIVGSDGSETSRLKAMAAQQAGILFLSSIPDERLIRLYKDCEALICASSIEGFCLPVAEALSLRRRVVCSDIPVLKEVAGEQATYFPLEPRSPDALVDAIAECLKSDRHIRFRSPLLQQNSGEQVAKAYRGILKLPPGKYSGDAQASS